MKRSFLMALFVILLFFLCSLGSTWAKELEFTLESPDYKIVSREGKDRIGISGYGRVEIPGVPILPKKVVWAALPVNAKSDSVTVKISHMDRREIAEKLAVPPAPPAVSTSEPGIWWGQGRQIQDRKDVSVYETDDYYPEKPVSVDGVYRLRDRKLARITFLPVQYNPVSQRARYVRQIRFQLVFDETAGEKGKTKTGPDYSSDHSLPAPILNPDTVETKGTSGNGYAVVTTDNLLAGLYTPGAGSALYDFADHKTSLGFTVYLVTQTLCIPHSDGASETGYGNNSGQQRAIDVRNWLIANHGAGEKSVKYVLLIGDPDPDDPGDPADSYGEMPMLMCHPKITGDAWSSAPETPTDYFFADLTGNWDLNDNGIYGEFPEDRGAGGIDFLPEVYVGRIPFSDPAAVESILEKTMEYENVTYSPGDNSRLAWRKKALLPMSILSYGTQWHGCSHDPGFTDDAFLGVSSQIHALHPNGFDTFLLTEQEGDPEYPDVGWHATSEIIGDAPLYKYTGDSSGHLLDYRWNDTENFGLVFWSLHGDSTGISRKNWTEVNPAGCPHFDNYFWRSHAAGLSDTRPAFLVSTACLIGDPEYSDSHGKSLGRELIQNGTIVAMANSREAWYYTGNFSDSDDGYLPGISLSNSEIRATVYYYAQQLSEDIPAGDAVFYARQSKDPNIQMAWANNFVSNIYGDPSLKILPPGFDTQTDSDSDGLSDDEENYIYLSDATDSDTDDDGLTDGEELIAHQGRWQSDVDSDGLDIFHDPDSDGDGLDDEIEIQVFSTDPSNPDSDGDGLNDFAEVSRDGDPSDYTENIDADPNDPDTDDDGVMDGDEVSVGMDPVDPWDNKPTADAGPDQTVAASPSPPTQVMLDGTGSFDPNADPLFYYWKIESSMSEYSQIDDRNDPTPVLNAAAGGDYLISLKVREDLENWVWSELDHVTIHVEHKIFGISPTAATWGDSLTIIGTGFDKDVSDNTVTVGGVTAVVTAAAYDELVITVPAGCSRGSVVVTVNGRDSEPASFDLQAPAGSFSSAPTSALPQLLDCSQAAAFGDVDGDGDIDLAVANMGGLDETVKNYDDSSCSNMDPQNRLYLNNGSGGFSDITFGADGIPDTADDYMPSDSDQSVDVVLRDIDTDGDLDMIIGNQGALLVEDIDCGMADLESCTGYGEQNKVYINDGSGRFTDETLSRLPAVTDITNDIAVADVNGDTHPDIYTANQIQCSSNPYQEPCQSYCCDTYCRNCVDFDCNSVCCTSCGEENCGWIWYGEGCENYPNSPCCDGTCDACEEPWLCFECCGESDCDISDCRNCCYDCSQCPTNPGCTVDFIPETATDRLYINYGGGVFTESAAGFLQDDSGRDDNFGETRSVSLKDLDGDGDPDLVRDGRSYSYNRLQWYANNGGTFTRQDDYLARKDNIKSILAADFSGSSDGLKDVFAPVSASGGDYPAYLGQESAGMFVNHGHNAPDDWLPAGFNYSDFQSIVSGAAEDVDLDGLSDIILGRGGNLANYLFLNDLTHPGRMIHTDGMIPDTAGNSYGTALGDVNGDGDPDLFFANSGQNRLLMNNTVLLSSCAMDLEGNDKDVDGKDISACIQAGDMSILAEFAVKFGTVDCSNQ